MIKRKLIIHCSDSPHPQHGVDEIKKWHIEKGWSDIGYQWVIEKSGELKQGRKYYPGAHTLGHNYEIGLCLCGLSHDFNNDQMKTLESFVIDNNTQMSSIHQHSDFDDKKQQCAGLTVSQMEYLNSLV